MTELDLTLIIAGVIAGAAPIVLAAIGETVTEKSGLINLSLDGSILLAAMTSFVAARKADSLLAGFTAGALVGAALAAAVAVLKQLPITRKGRRAGTAARRPDPGR